MTALRPLLLRTSFAVAVTAAAVWFLLEGLPIGAVAVVAAGVLARRSAEAGRVRRFADRV